MEPKPETVENFSPLHDLLGIDKETGQFKPPQPVVEKSDAKNDRVNTSTEPLARHAVQDHPNNLPASDDLEEATQAIEQFANRVQRMEREGGLDDLAAILGDGFKTEQVQKWNRLFAWLTAVVLLVYPLGIILSEIVALFWHSRRERWTEADRSYLRSRFWQRIALAMVWIGLILLLTLATVNTDWWSDPMKLSSLALGAVLLALAASTLSSLVKQAAGERPLAVMREVQQEQLELRKDMDELQKRLRQVTIRGG